jgi:hypothetical protein
MKKERNDGKITDEYTKLFEDVYEDMYNLQCKFLRHFMWSENVPNMEGLHILSWWIAQTNVI